MIMPFCSDEKPPSYKEYKNRSFTKHIDKITNQLRQIRECSLKEDDKNRLKIKLQEIITESFFQTPQGK